MQSPMLALLCILCFLSLGIGASGALEMGLGYAPHPSPLWLIQAVDVVPGLQCFQGLILR